MLNFFTRIHPGTIVVVRRDVLHYGVMLQVRCCAKEAGPPGGGCGGAAGVPL